MLNIMRGGYKMSEIKMTVTNGAYKSEITQTKDMITTRIGKVDAEESEVDRIENKADRILELLDDKDGYYTTPPVPDVIAKKFNTGKYAEKDSSLETRISKLEAEVSEILSK